MYTFHLPSLLFNVASVSSKSKIIANSYTIVMSGRRIYWQKNMSHQNTLALLMPSNLLSTNMPPSVIRGTCLESQSVVVRRGLLRFREVRFAPGRNGRLEKASGVVEEPGGAVKAGFCILFGVRHARSIGSRTWYLTPLVSTSTLNNLTYLIHLPPQLIVIQIAPLLIPTPSHPILGSIPCNRQQCRDERLLEIRKAEILSYARDSWAQFLWETDRRSIFEFLPLHTFRSQLGISVAYSRQGILMKRVSGWGAAFCSRTISCSSRIGTKQGSITPKCRHPVITLHDTLGFRGERKEIIPVKAAGPARETWVQLVKVVGACYHEGAVVVF